MLARQPVSRRMNSHMFDINNFDDPSFSSRVATYCKSDNHSMADFSFMSIDVIDNNFDRLLKETYWMHKLRTVYPEGIIQKCSSSRIVK